jgi:hypothetical protein
MQQAQMVKGRFFLIVGVLPEVKKGVGLIVLLVT